MLDEADEMLSRGFKEQIHDVFTKMPYNIQVILLSATMPQDVLDVTKKFMRDPIRILVKKEELTLEGIKQFYIMVGREVRLPLDFILFSYCYCSHARSHIDLREPSKKPSSEIICFALVVNWRKITFCVQHSRLGYFFLYNYSRRLFQLFVQIFLYLSPKYQ